jgi:hypothetical protein
MLKEKRKTQQQATRYVAWVPLTDGQRHFCVVSDATDSGARIDLKDAMILPDSFVLMLTINGAARRYCRVIWRKPTQVGVKFEGSMVAAMRASLIPKADANARAALAADEAAKTI